MIRGSLGKFGIEAVSALKLLFDDVDPDCNGLGWIVADVKAMVLGFSLVGFEEPGVDEPAVSARRNNEGSASAHVVDLVADSVDSFSLAPLAPSDVVVLPASSGLLLVPVRKLPHKEDVSVLGSLALADCVDESLFAEESVGMALPADGAARGEDVLDSKSLVLGDHLDILLHQLHQVGSCCF